MCTFRYCSRRFWLIYRRFEGHQRKTTLLYFLNLIFVMSLALQLASRRALILPPSFADSYKNDISYAMDAFDFMHAQRIAAKPIPPPEDQLRMPLISKRCPSWRPNGDLSENVAWNNLLWQSVSPSSVEIYLYSAFFDDRPNAIFPTANGAVQIIGVVWRRLSENVYCRLWNKDHTSTVVKALVREIWQKAWDPRDRFYVPVLFTCPLPLQEGSPVPVYVTLVEDDSCHLEQPPSTLLVVRSHKTTLTKARQGDKKGHTVVCVKGMDFLDDLSSRFVEWLELNFHVGADKIVIYTYSVHPRVKRVIDYYSSRSGRLEHVPLTLPGNAPNAPLHRSRYIKRNRQQKRRHELVPYNDCLYRHVGTHQFVLIVDVDELIVPISHSDWKEVIEEVKRGGNGEDANWTAFSIANAFFFDNLTKNEPNSNFTHILRHDKRSRRISPPGIYGKSFMDTRNVATVFNHFPLHKHKWTSDSILRPTFYVDPKLARKNHYKNECPIESRDECPDLYRYVVRDNSATRYAPQVAPKIQAALKAIGIEP